MCSIQSTRLLQLNQASLHCHGRRHPERLSMVMSKAGAGDGARGRHAAVDAELYPAMVEFAMEAGRQRKNLSDPVMFWKVPADPFDEDEPADDDMNTSHSSLTNSNLFLGQKGPYLIWNRACYDALSAKIEERLLQGYRRFIILGTAGIGKSWFAIVWILKLAQKGEKVVLKQGSEFHILDFSKQEEPFVAGPFAEMHPIVQKYLLKSSTWLVIDGKQAERMRYACRILVACSTNPSNFEEFRKHRRACTLYMPAWREEEVKRFLIDFEPFRDAYSGMEINTKAKALQLFKELGGVPRYILEHMQSAYGLLRQLNAVSSFSLNIEPALQALAGYYVKDISDRVVHIYTDDYETPRYEFASSRVRENIVAKLYLANTVRIAALLEATKHVPGLETAWGTGFEVLVHKYMINGGRFRVKRVYEGGRFDPVQVVTVPPQNRVPFGTFEELGRMAATGNYLMPKRENFIFLDAILGFIVIQVFNRLGYAISGLVQLDEQLNRAEYELWCCVAPEQFDVTGWQSFLTKEGTLYRRNTKAISSLVKKCKQYVCEVDYHMLV